MANKPKVIAGKPKLASPLPPGWETTSPSWWDPTILGPYPGIWTQEQVSRLCELMKKLEIVIV